MKSFLVDQDGYYGEFGGAYVPEILHKCVEELTNKYLEVIESEEFKKEFEQLLRDYVDGCFIVKTFIIYLVVLRLFIIYLSTHFNIQDIFLFHFDYITLC